MTLRSLLYRLARLLGDLNVQHCGPRAAAKRSVRRALCRAVGKVIKRLAPPA